MVEAIVEHDYLAKEPDELSIKKGDIIKNVIKKQAGWCEGVLKDRKGLFPDNFVKIREAEVAMRSRMDVNRIRKCRVIFSYKQDHEDELNLSVDDVIEIIGEEEEGWWRGTLHGKTGVFPSNFVEELPGHKLGSVEDLAEADAKTPSLPPKPTKILCEVKYSYKSQNDDELSLKEGDIITLISKDGQDAGWWRGELNGRIGVFPDNFVLIIDEKQPKSGAPPAPTNHVNKYVASERKSFDAKLAKPQEPAESSRATPPAVPGKKPSLAIKKSPSGSGGSGLFSGLRKKIVDAVDGASASKRVDLAGAKPDSDPLDNAFDQVERNSMLVDVRATRAKPPGRRPPSVILKEGDLQPVAMQNGNSDYGSLEEKLLTLSDGGGAVDGDGEVMKPKVREWEKNRVPWLEEMKQNQAKRTSTSPGPETRNRLTTPDKPEEKEASPVDMSKSMPSFTKVLKTPPNELEGKRPAVPSHRPQTIEAAVKPAVLAPATVTATTSTTKISPVAAPSKTPSPVVQKPPVVEKPAEIKDKVPAKQYNELLERLAALEALVERQHQVHKAAIDDLRGKLQLETDMRMLLQAELEKVAQCVMQV